MSDRQAAINQHIQADPYANFLGATFETITRGFSRVSLVVTAELLNFHGMTHGGVVFSLGDMAFAAASNSRGQTAVALNVNVSFMRATQVGDHLIAECQEQDTNGPIGLYDIIITEKKSGELVSRCQATVYRKRDWFVPLDVSQNQ